jgi:hypothetical protein
MDKTTDMNCRFGFGFGRFSGKVYLDNVSIQRVIPSGASQLVSSPDLLEVFPNPAQNSLIVKCKTDLKGAQIKLYNLQGKLISEFEMNKPLYSGREIRLDLNNSEFENGIYFLTVTEPGLTHTRKIVINRH